MKLTLPSALHLLLFCCAASAQINAADPTPDAVPTGDFGSAAEHLSELKRFALLDTEHKSEWLRKIARLCQEEGMRDKALAAAKRVTDDAPTDPDAFAIAADVNFTAEQFDAGVALLRKAIQLAGNDKQNDLRLWLGRALFWSGHSDEARQTYEEAFKAAATPAVRLPIIQPLVEVSARQGRLDELIDGFRKKEQSPQEGWRYALYLSEIYRLKHDYATAREELAKAGEPAARNADFLSQLLRLSQDEGNVRESARLARLLTEAAPDGARQLELASALLDNGDTVEAVKLLHANTGALFKAPLEWRDTLLKFDAAGVSEEVAQILQSRVKPYPADWRLWLLLAETWAYQGKLDDAEKLLWEIASLREDTQAEPKTPDYSAVSAFTHLNFDMGVMSRGEYGSLSINSVWYSSGAGSALGSKFAGRILRGAAARQQFARISAALEGVASLQNSRFSNFDFYATFRIPPAPQTLEDAHDTALVDLSIIAQRRGRAAEFLTALDTHLKDTPGWGRIAPYTLVEAREPLMRELAVEAAKPSAGAYSDADCLEVLMDLAQQNSVQGGGVAVGSPEEAELIHCIEAFLPRQKNPDAALGEKLVFHDFLKIAGRVEEAAKMADEIEKEADSVSRDRAEELFNFAIGNDRLEIAKKILSQAIETNRTAGAGIDESQIRGYRVRLAGALLKAKTDKNLAEQLLVAAIPESYRPHFPGVSTTPRNALAILRNAGQFPYANPYIGGYRNEVWLEIFGLVKPAGLLDEFKAALDQQAQTLPKDQAIQAGLARACFLWWNHEQEDAVRAVEEITAKVGDDNLRLLLASMLAEIGRSADAAKALSAVKATGGDVGLDKTARMLALALAAKDTAQAKKLALQLTGLPLEYNDQSILAQTLSELGLTDETAALKEKIRARELAMPGQYQLPLMLQQEVQAKHEKEALALARAILAEPPKSPAIQVQSYTRRSAIDAMRTFKALPAYIDELEKQLAETPSPIRVLSLLAEAHEHDEPKKALEDYRKLTALKPDDSGFQIRFADLLNTTRQPEEAARIWEALLARDPDAIVPTHFYPVINSFKTAKQMSRLGSILLQTPLPKNPLAGLASFPRDDNPFFNQVAQDLLEEGKTDEAIAVWRAGLDHTRAQGNFGYAESNLLKPMVSALIDLGKMKEAQEALEPFFLRPANSKKLLGFGVHFVPGTWSDVSFQEPGRIDVLGFGLLKLAAQAGGLDRLRAQSIATAGAHPNPTERCLVLLIDALRRDEAGLREITATFDQAFQDATEQRDVKARNLFFFLGEKLRGWPEARHLALHILKKSASIADGFETMKKLELADLAIELGDKDEARAALREWIDLEQTRWGQINSWDVQQQISAMNLMLKTGMETDARGLLPKLQANRNGGNDTETKRRSDDVANRIAILGGESKPVQVTAFALPAEKDAKHTSICWEIDAASDKGAAGDSWEKYPNLAGDDLSKLDGRFVLELFHGSSPTSMSKIATIPAAKARGVWESPEPLGQGYLQAILKEKDTLSFSLPVFITGTPNLLANPQWNPTAPDPGKPGAALRSEIPGWPGVSPLDFYVKQGGPIPGGNYVHLEVSTDLGQRRIAGERIPLESGKSYVFTAWLRTLNGGHRVGISSQFLDKNGAPLRAVSGNTFYTTDRWTLATVRLIRRHSARPDGTTVEIPEKAAFFVPIIETLGTACEMNSLYFGEVAP